MLVPLQSDPWPRTWPRLLRSLLCSLPLVRCRSPAAQGCMGWQAPHQGPGIPHCWCPPPILPGGWATGIQTRHQHPPEGHRVTDRTCSGMWQIPYLLQTPPREWAAVTWGTPFCPPSFSFLPPGGSTHSVFTVHFPDCGKSALCRAWRNIGEYEEN